MLASHRLSKIQNPKSKIGRLSVYGIGSSQKWDAQPDGGRCATLRAERRAAPWRESVSWREPAREPIVGAAGAASFADGFNVERHDCRFMRQPGTGDVKSVASLSYPQTKTISGATSLRAYFEMIPRRGWRPCEADCFCLRSGILRPDDHEYRLLQNFI
jgi:hypothetical protein